MAKGDRRVEIYCPKCSWKPHQMDRWACGDCQCAWNTFDTAGVCPDCGKVHEDTQCPSCLAWSPHRSWYHNFGFDEESESVEEIQLDEIKLR